MLRQVWNSCIPSYVTSLDAACVFVYRCHPDTGKASLPELVRVFISSHRRFHRSSFARVQHKLFAAPHNRQRLASTYSSVSLYGDLLVGMLFELEPLDGVTSLGFEMTDIKMRCARYGF